MHAVAVSNTRSIAPMQCSLGHGGSCHIGLRSHISLKPSDCRWTMDLQPKLGLRRPHILVTGRSFYGWDSIDGKLNYQKDVWDSLQDNQYLSAEAVAYIIRSLLNLQVQPGWACSMSLLLLCQVSSEPLDLRPLQDAPGQQAVKLLRV